jgi:anti-sigma-K factor RskA
VGASPPHDLVAGYALDALDEPDRRLFEEHLAECEECVEGLRSFREASSALALDAEPATPPPDLRARLLDAAREERPAATVVSLRRRIGLPAVAAIAAVAACAAIGLGIWAASLQGSLSRERDARDAREEALGILADPAARRVPVKGTDGVLAVANDGRAALALAKLDPAPGGKTYEAWVIDTKTPKPAGLFSGSDGSPTVVPIDRPVRPGAVVAVTVEPDGGVDAPTSTPIITAQA